ncbi:conjugal transfer protein TraR [Paenibacillus pasadenensis]|uniref:conjugal transfer protein TraR n=1 Tax=Paenibacillus pasadenensis TaxID=217090 RepID=UPI00203FBCB7|nr:conjugal transfer protein TraR [Paenibacillus pasadenensis]MCM3745849.1 conjugal transfer protein TraR [Paenibacillus pasadenensis]
MRHLKPSQIDQLKQALLREKEELEAHFQINGERTDDGAPASMADSGGELSSYDNHPGDSATETFERERDMALDEKLGKKLAQVNRALSQMADGTYGLDASSGKPIPFERLEAIPSVRYTVDNVPQNESEAERPVEEQVMTLPPKGAGEGRQASAGRFDDAGAWETLENYGNASDTVNPQSEAGAANELEKLR